MSDNDFSFHTVKARQLLEKGEGHLLLGKTHEGIVALLLAETEIHKALASIRRTSRKELLP